MNNQKSNCCNNCGGVNLLCNNNLCKCHLVYLGKTTTTSKSEKCYFCEGKLNACPYCGGKAVSKSEESRYEKAVRFADEVAVKLAHQFDPPTRLENWEKRFEEWYDLYYHKSPSENTARKWKLKELISTLLREQREEQKQKDIKIVLKSRIDNAPESLGAEFVNRMVTIIVNDLQQS